MGLWLRLEPLQTLLPWRHVKLCGPVAELANVISKGREPQVGLHEFRSEHKMLEVRYPNENV